MKAASAAAWAVYCSSVFQGFQTTAATSSVHAGEFMTIGGGVEGGQQGGTTPIYQNGAPQGHWQDVSYNVGGSSSTSERRITDSSACCAF